MSDLVTAQTLRNGDRTHSEIAVPPKAVGNPESNVPSNTFWLLLPASAFFLLLPIILTLNEIRTSWQQWQTQRRINAITPCRNCHFFSPNIRLNCAVHPCQVLTKEAVNCPDFRPKETQKHPRQTYLKK